VYYLNAPEAGLSSRVGGAAQAAIGLRRCRAELLSLHTASTDRTFARSGRTVPAGHFSIE